ncbi:MAG: CRISPR-associated endonuclease Cas2 [Syntrophobacteraceae bacterium]|nr:CRISPR-associated endonuclease Cas2 [Syntrophobacteraceae bacterium]
MSRKTAHILASYDIHDPRRLARVAKIMKNYGERVQKSVFECNLGDEHFARMKDRVDSVIDHAEDSVRYYFICDKCIDNVDVVGLGRGFAEDSDIAII